MKHLISVQINVMISFESDNPREEISKIDINIPFKYRKELENSVVLLLSEGDTVNVPDPYEDGFDGWKHSFIGTVLEFVGEGVIKVIDQDENVFTIESWRVDRVEMDS